MIKTLRFTLMAVMMLICGAISAQTVVTFTAGTDKSEGATLTKGGIHLPWIREHLLQALASWQQQSTDYIRAMSLLYLLQ